MEELDHDKSSGAFTLKHCAFSVSSAIISARMRSRLTFEDFVHEHGTKYSRCRCKVLLVTLFATYRGLPPSRHHVVLSHVLHLAEPGPAELVCMGSDRLHVLRVIVRLAFVLFRLECQISCEVFLHVVVSACHSVLGFIKVFLLLVEHVIDASTLRFSSTVMAARMARAAVSSCSVWQTHQQRSETAWKLLRQIDGNCGRCEGVGKGMIQQLWPRRDQSKSNPHFCKRCTLAP